MFTQEQSIIWKTYFVPNESYDTENLNWAFAVPPHSGAIFSSQTPIFCHSHRCAGPRYGSCPYQPASVRYMLIYARKNTRIWKLRCQKTCKKLTILSRALDVIAIYAIKKRTSKFFYWFGPHLRHPTATHDDPKLYWAHFKTSYGLKYLRINLTKWICYFLDLLKKRSAFLRIGLPIPP